MAAWKLRSRRKGMEERSPRLLEGSSYAACHILGVREHQSFCTSTFGFIVSSQHLSYSLDLFQLLGWLRSLITKIFA